MAVPDKRKSVVFAATFAVGVLAVLFAGWWFGTGYRRFLKPEVPVCGDCNVVVIAIDPLRADGLHALGNPRSMTPRLDALAARGYLFTNAYSVSSWTLPAAMSLFTGTYPSEHRITNKELIGATEKDGLIPASLAVTAPAMQTMASVFKSRGFVTGGFAGGAALSPSYGFDRGFDEYASDGEFNGLPSVIPKALSFAKKNKDKRLFLFVHGFDVHGQYTPPGGIQKTYADPSYKGRLTGTAEEQKALREEGVINQEVYLKPEDVTFLRAVYDEKVREMDRNVETFLSEYEKLGLSKKTIFVFTSNHGEEFYEHGRIDHGMTLYDEVIHVPLIIALPGATGSVRVTDQVRTIDIMPTLFRLTGVAVPAGIAAQMRGTDLTPAMRGQNMRLDLYAETQYRYATFLRAIRTWDGWKLINDDSQSVQRLYNINTDRGERRDLAGSDPASQSRLTAILLKMTEIIKRASVTQP